jgi:hypothetical protein
VGVLGVPQHPPELGGSEKSQSLISAYRSLAITASTSGFEKLSTALLGLNDGAKLWISIKLFS